MYSEKLPANASPVVSLDHDRALAGERLDPRLQDVARGRRSGWHAPTTIVVEQRRLCLRAGKAELPGEVTAQPCRVVLAQLAQALSNFSLVEPPHGARGAHRLERLLDGSEAHGASAIMTDRRREQGIRFERCMELPGPALEDTRIVGERTPEPGTDRSVWMRADRRRHRYRQGRRPRRCAVVVVVVEAQATISGPRDRACDEAL
jgi:hypothetical protein